MKAPSTPLVVQYLYVHETEEGFYYPTARGGSSAALVAQRYLECALTQVATLALRELDCELVLATNVTDRSTLGRTGAALLGRIEALGARILPTPYRHRPRPGTEIYVSSRYVLDAIIASTEGLDPARQVWLTDLDCVWTNPELVFAAAPAADQVGCVQIDYPPDWDIVEFDVYGRTRAAIGELARAMGADVRTPPWVGGELLTGTPQTLREMVAACEQLDEQLAAEDKTLPNEEQILSLAGALGRVRFADLSGVARRITTGPRSQAARVTDAETAGLWHLPAEKGLSLRRTGQQVRRGRTGPLRRDLADPARMARRFNVGRAGPMRRLRDDGWIVAHRMNGLRPRTAGG
jgi:hypothetical protein